MAITEGWGTRMTDPTDNSNNGIARRTVLKAAASAGAVGLIGLPALSGSVAASGHIATTTVVSDTDTTVTRRRAGTGENASECTFTDLGVDAVPSWEHPAWSDTTTCFEGTGADWIWYSTEGKQVPDNDEYYVLNNVYGDVVEFEREFDVAGPPTGGTLTIAVDNGFEAYVNGLMVASRAVNDGEEVRWECSDLKLPYVETDGWRTDGDCANITFPVPAEVLQEGPNTLTVLAVNAHNRREAEELEDGENPAGLIYELDVGYERCELCESGTDLLEKWEFVETDEGCSFEREADKGDDPYIGDVVSYETKTDEGEDEACEPVSVTFETEYCDGTLDAVVKAGSELIVYEDLPVSDGTVTVTNGDVKYAISNVRFYCQAPEDTSLGNGKAKGHGEAKGKGKEKGKGKGKGRDDR
jgi:hypothetical protein